MSVAILKQLTGSVTEGFDTSKFDLLYDEFIFPYLKVSAERFKTNKVRITDNLSCNKAHEFMKIHFNSKFTVQSLIETEMKFYLQEKGFKVLRWKPSYSVELVW